MTIENALGVFGDNDLQVEYQGKDDDVNLTVRGDLGPWGRTNVLSLAVLAFDKGTRLHS